MLNFFKKSKGVSLVEMMITLLLLMMIGAAVHSVLNSSTVFFNAESGLAQAQAQLRNLSVSLEKDLKSGYFVETRPAAGGIYSVLIKQNGQGVIYQWNSATSFLQRTKIGGTGTAMAMDFNNITTFSFVSYYISSVFKVEFNYGVQYTGIINKPIKVSSKMLIAPHSTDWLLYWGGSF